MPKEHSNGIYSGTLTFGKSVPMNQIGCLATQLADYPDEGQFIGALHVGESGTGSRFINFAFDSRKTTKEESVGFEDFKRDVRRVVRRHMNGHRVRCVFSKRTWVIPCF